MAVGDEFSGPRVRGIRALRRRARPAVRPVQSAPNTEPGFSARETAPFRPAPATDRCRVRTSFEVGTLWDEQQLLCRMTPGGRCPIAEDDDAHAVPLTAC